jgi:glycosyltransferase involved in cell wall biosynthesis
MMFTKISAIVSVFNAGEFLPHKMKSLLSQSIMADDRLEIVFINANSPNQDDHVLLSQYAKDYPFVTVVNMPHRIGVYHAWNIGIQMATGDYVVNSNVDDPVLPDAYEAMALELDRGNDVVYGNWYATTSRAPLVDDWQPYLAQPNDYPLGVSHYGNHPVSAARLADFCHWSCGVMWRRSLHNNIGWFDPSFSICGDYDMWCRMMLAGCDVVALPCVLGWFYFSPEGSNISFSNGEQFGNEVRRIRLMYSDRLRGMDDDKPDR